MSDWSDLSDLSSDEEVRQLRVFRERMNPLNHYSDDEFKARYRIAKPVFEDLMGQLAQLEPITQRNHAISAKEQVLLTIHFYASGSFQITVADHIRVHKSTACRVIKKVSAEIAKLRPQYIKMPVTDAQRATIRNGFYAISGFPKVTGAVDCTHIKIQSPGGPMAERFRNRKGFFSLNVQAVCDAQLRILDIISRWQGSVHDTSIFNDSHLRAEFEMGVYGDDVLLGDSGYPCRKYLLTPFIQPATASEEAYNRAQIATRNPIERCFGVLKRRFPCLSMGLRVKLDTAMNIVVACAVLHNIALHHNDIVEDIPDMEPEETVDLPAQPQAGAANENFSVRSALLLTHFNH